MAEAGVSDLVVASWYGVFVPTGVPAEIVRTLNRAINEVLAQPEIKTKTETAETSRIIGGFYS